MKRQPRKLKWTKTHRALRGKEMIVDSSLLLSQFAKKRNVPVKLKRSGNDEKEYLRRKGLLGSWLASADVKKTDAWSWKANTLFEKNYGRWSPLRFQLRRNRRILERYWGLKDSDKRRRPGYWWMEESKTRWILTNLPQRLRLNHGWCLRRLLAVTYLEYLNY
jgi:hypothetical protein